MKLIKAVVATAFSVVLFAPASFAQVSPTKTEDSKQFSFSHGQNFTCSIADGTQTNLELQTSGSDKDSLTASVTGLEITNNGPTSVTFASSNVATPSGSDFTMTAGGASKTGGDQNILIENVTTGTSFDLDVAFSNGATPGSYGAVVTVTCAYTGGESQT